MRIPRPYAPSLSMRIRRSYAAAGLIAVCSHLHAAEPVPATSGAAAPQSRPEARVSQDAGTAAPSGKGAEASATAAPSAAPAVTPAAPAAAAPSGVPATARTRLPRTVLPESNRVSLVLDPDKEVFSGRIEITARVAAPVRELWLNSRNLTLSEATVRAGGTSWDLEVLPQEKDSGTVGFRSARTIPAGSAVIAIAFTGKIDATETEGIFRQKEGDAWYLFTQFEAIAARKAFPCFDEPDSKVPWRLTLEVPKGLA